MLDRTSIGAPPGPAWCRDWTDRVDAVVRESLASRSWGGGVAVVALGGYARRELCPASDVDLLLLHDGWGNADLEGLVTALCYPLWDAGLSLGHAVRTPKEAVRAAGERIDTATALTDRRFVAGEVGLADELAARVARWLRRSAATVVTDLAAADADRRRGAGVVPGMLEPDLKGGAGGLRDIHSLRWAAACLLGEPGLDALVGARYLGAADRADLSRAAAVLLEARCALHLVTGARSGSGVDRLRLDLQDEVAAMLGDADGDVLLRRVGLAGRAVAHLHGRTWPLLSADARGGRRRRRPAPRTIGAGLTLVDGVVETADSSSLRTDPGLGLRAVAAAARHGTRLGRGTVRRLRTDLAEVASLTADTDARAALELILGLGSAALPAIADADHLGLVDAYLPEWSRVRGRPQRNPLHRFDLDTHGLQAVVELERIRTGELDEAHREVAERVVDPTALLLGTWLHDVGKAWPGNHSETGVDVTRRWLSHLGYAPEVVERVGALVRWHLLLPDVASRRDLDDPREIEAVAATLGDAGLLDELYLLSLADSRATGPAAWSAWKDSLLARLHREARAVLTGETAVVERPDTSAAVATLRTALGPDAPLAGDLLDGAPERYLEVVGPEQAAEHARLLAPPPAPGELRASFRPGPAEGTLALGVVGPDRPGLIAVVAGVLAGHGAEVLDARAFTRDDGMVLDVFIVAGSDGGDEVLADLAVAAAGDLDVARLVARREARRDARPVPLARPVEVTVHVEARDDRVRVEVGAPDSPGLLWRLATALSDAGLDVVGARVSTLGPEARDVFDLRPWTGGPTGEELRAALESAARRPA